MRPVLVFVLALLCLPPAARAEYFALGSTVYRTGHPFRLCSSGDVGGILPSPDGRHLLLVHRAGPYTAAKLSLVSTALPDSSRQVMAADPTAAAGQPPGIRTIDVSLPGALPWAPDSSAFLVETRGAAASDQGDTPESSTLWLVPVDGRGPQVLAETGADCLGWAGRLVYYRPRRGGPLTVIDPATGAKREVDREADGDVTWDAAAGRLLYARRHWVDDANFRDVRVAYDPVTGACTEIGPVDKEPMTNQVRRVESSFPSPDHKAVLASSRSAHEAFGGRSEVILRRGGDATNLTKDGRGLALGWLPTGQGALWARVVDNTDAGGRPHPAGLQLWLTSVSGPQDGWHHLLAPSFSLPAPHDRWWSDCLPRCWPDAEHLVYLDQGDLVCLPLERSSLPIEPDGTIVDPEVLDALTNQAKELSLAALMFVEDHDGRYPDPGNWSETILPYLGSGSVFALPGAGSPLDFTYALPEGAMSSGFDNAGRVLMLQVAYGPWYINVYADGHVSRVLRSEWDKPAE